MALVPLADSGALEDWLGVTFADGAEQDRADAVLAHASAAVRVYARRNWVDEEGELDEVPEGIPEIVVRVAARMLANPSGLQSRTTGPFSATFGELELTDAEKDAISATLRSTTGGVWTLATTRGLTPDTSTILVPVVGSDEPLPVSLDEPW